MLPSSVPVTPRGETAFVPPLDHSSAPDRVRDSDARSNRQPVAQRGRGRILAGTPDAALATVLRLGIAAVFVIAGGAKLLGLGSTVALFKAVGVGQWFRYVTGLGELTGATLLALPRTTLLGALLLGGLMVGAVGTEVFILRRMPVSSVATLCALGVLVWLEIRSRWSS